MSARRIENSHLPAKIQLFSIEKGAVYKGNLAIDILHKITLLTVYKT